MEGRGEHDGDGRPVAPWDPGSIDVVVPTFRRPVFLAQCLAALGAQELAPARVVVPVRPEDEASRRVIGTAGIEVHEVLVAADGLMAALRAGVAATRAGLVAVVDDDARPAPDWLRRIVERFADPTIGCVGGRPRDATPVRPGIVVGRIDRFGRLTGNHGVGSGPMRDVDAVAGGSMALRAEALALPCAGVLLGTGAEPFNEMLIAAWTRKTGYRVVYDPAIVVDHRLGIDQLPQDDLARGRASEDWTRAVAHNWLVGVTAHGERPIARVLAYGLLVGTRGTPGLVRTAVAITRGEREVVRRLPASVRGQLAGARAARAGAARRMVSCADLRNAREGG